MAISFTQFESAIQGLALAIAQPKNEFLRDSVIQRFEFCVDLAWKVSKKTMGTSTTAPKEIVREMAQNQLITDVKVWLESIDMRNLSSLAYNEELAEKVYLFAVQFQPELNQLKEKLKLK